MKIECGILVALLVVCVIVEARRPRCTELTCPGLEQVCKMTRPDNCPRSINKGKRCRRKPTCVTDHFTIGPVVEPTVDPRFTRPGVCPPSILFCMDEPFPECGEDADCLDPREKCCGSNSFGYGNKRHCRVPFHSNTGACPRMKGPPPANCDRHCKQLCYQDGECDIGEICCFDSCNNHCFNPIDNLG